MIDFAKTSYCCKECGILFTGNKRKYCCRACREKNQNRRSVAKRKLNPPEPNIKKTCRQCGVDFMTLDNRAKFCSMLCKYASRRFKPLEKCLLDRARCKKRRDVIRSGEKFTKIEIYERDGWKCKICGRKINKSKRWPDIHSASLDHIIPLVRGGKHTRANVQCACLQCNSRKTFRIKNGQLRLF